MSNLPNDPIEIPAEMMTSAVVPGAGVEVLSALFPTLERITTEDQVGPDSANRQPIALEKRTIELLSQVNKVIDLVNALDITFLRRVADPPKDDGGTGDKTGILSDMPCHNHTLTGIRDAAADGEPVTKRQFLSLLPPASEPSVMRDMLAVIDSSRAPQTPAFVGGATSLGSGAIGRWQFLTAVSTGVATRTVLLPPLTPTPPAVGSFIALKVPFSSGQFVSFAVSASGGTIDGQAAITLLPGNYVILMFNGGTDWQIVSADFSTRMRDCSQGGVGVIIGTTSVVAPIPAKPSILTNITRDRVMFKRLGDIAQCRYEYDHKAAGVAGAAGDYLFSLPPGMSFHSSVDLVTVAANLPGQWTNLRVARGGQSYITNGSSIHEIMAVPYDATRFRIWGEAVNGSGRAYLSNTFYQLSNVNLRFALEFSAPMAGW